MKSGVVRPVAGVLLTLLLVLGACSPQAVRQKPSAPAAETSLTAGETIAGEILAYLMEVVLGRAGPPDGRAAWASRGTDLPLSFELVKARMFGPVHQRAELMVLDTNILGLSQVLYHYDRRLNLFKGRLDHDSLYPCAELMALRLLLLRKLDRGERVSLAAIRQHQALFTGADQPIDAGALAAMNLSEVEFDFLRAVFRSEPAFLRYMQHPFIVSTLKRIGVAAQDTVTLMADQSANYRPWACPNPSRYRSPTVVVAILPAMAALFDAPPAEIGAVQATGEYRQLVSRLQGAIREGLDRRRVAPVGERLRFFTPERPMVIHPQNAGRVIETVCPNADFTVVILGKNVYRAIFIDPGSDIYPHERRIYLDVDDIRYQSLDDVVSTIAAALAPALRP